MASSTIGRRLSRDALRIVGSLEQHGMLLVQDDKLPNLVSEVVGSPIRGSWWGHPASQEIFRILNEVAGDTDTCLTKLLNKKQTLVTRALFAPLLVVGRTRAPWQMRGLSKSAHEVLEQIDRGEHVLATGDTAAKLELALLVASQECHTKSGAHAKELFSWPAFARLRRVTDGGRTLASAKAELELVAQRLESEFNAKARLPWLSAAGAKPDRARVLPVE